MDVVFAIDVTSPIEEFNSMKTFIKEAIQPINIQSGKEARVGVVSFNSDITTLSDFDRRDKSTIASNLESLKQKKGSRDISQSLKSIKESFFQPRTTRKEANKLIVLLSSGDDSKSDFTDLNQILQSLNQSDIKTMIIRIGESSEQSRRMEQITNQYGIMFNADSYRELPKFFPNVLETANRKTGMQKHI